MPGLLGRLGQLSPPSPGFAVLLSGAAGACGATHAQAVPPALAGRGEAELQTGCEHQFLCQLCANSDVIT